MLQRLRTTFCSLLFATTSAFIVGACDGGSGDPCQVESDCDEGLLCCGAARFGNPTRGVCASSCSDVRDDAAMMDATSGDAMMSMPDSSLDSTVEGGASDSGADAAAPDATFDAAADAQVDARTSDASPDAG